MNDSTLAHLEGLLIGHSPIMHRLRREIARVAPSSLPVLIQGSTGSGKELVARGLHLSSGRDGPFVAMNVCAVPDAMFEDALFGHVRGAFTGAHADAVGYLAEADGGTIMLDEINGLSLTAQAKLLRAIETGIFRPVGARRDRQSSFRVIAATNVDLVGLVASGTFRQDLFYRLSGLTVCVPDLRHRLDDLPELVSHFLRQDRANAVDFSADALAELRRHVWPGNVRELRSVVARATLLANGRQVDVASARMAIGANGLFNGRVISRIPDARAELVALLDEYRWDTSKVADHLGVHRATVYRRMQRLGLNETAVDANTR
jgi:DNA-binding NtrC family response regulator